MAGISMESVFCVVGYAFASMMILDICAVPFGSVEWMLAILGGAPIGWYCSKLDAEGR